MMSVSGDEILEATQQVRNLERMFKAFTTVAGLLEKLGPLQKAIEETDARLQIKRVEEQGLDQSLTSLKEKAASLEEHIALASQGAEKILSTAKAGAKQIEDEAKAKAQKLEQDAHIVAEKITSRATKAADEAEQRRAKAEVDANQMLAVLNERKAEKDRINNEIEKAKKVLSKFSALKNEIDE